MSSCYLHQLCDKGTIIFPSQLIKLKFTFNKQMAESWFENLSSPSWPCVCSILAGVPCCRWEPQTLRVGFCVSLSSWTNCKGQSRTGQLESQPKTLVGPAASFPLLPELKQKETSMMMAGRRCSYFAINKG